MTSDTVPAPYIVSGTATYYGEWRAFATRDPGNPYSAPWLTNLADSPYVQLDLGAGHTQPLFTYIVKVADDPTRAPKAWTVRGSTDNFVASNDLLDTVTGQTGWGAGEIRAFTCDVAGTPYQQFRLHVTDNNGSSVIAILNLFYYNSAADILISHLSLVVWVEYIPDTQPTALWGQGYVFLGDPAHPPGSVTNPGNGIVYQSGAALAKSRLAFTLPLNGTGVLPATPDGADATNTVVWFAVVGSVLQFNVPNYLNVYAVYFQADYSDGSSRFSYPTAETVDQNVGTVTNPANAIDHDLNSFADILRQNFSGLGTATYLRIAGFGLFVVAPTVGCNSPPNGTVGVAYNHPLTVASGYSPYSAAISAGSLPTGMSLVVAGSLVSAAGTPTHSGTYAFTVHVTDAIGSTADVACAITIVNAGPCPEGTGAMIGPG